jgi:NAD(P)-dependent dehydrogenase (short-subunit alcohol dehydrogenase family)
MLLRDKVIVITGAAGGIGAALAHRFAVERPTGIVVSDVDGDAARDTAASLDGKAIAVQADVTDPAQVLGIVAATERSFGPVDLFCSNAGVAAGTGLDAPEAAWSLAWSVNVMAHVHAANAVLPSMLARGEGYLLNTVSAAGLLSLPGDAPYTATKHAALGFAEWLSITYGGSGIRVSALCPLGVRTGMLMPGLEAGNPSALAVAASGPVLEPGDVAEITVKGIAAERFLILPHPEVGAMYAAKAADVDHWLGRVQQVFDPR